MYISNVMTKLVHQSLKFSNIKLIHLLKEEKRDGCDGNL